VIEYTLGRSRTDARQQVHDAETGDAVAGILDEPQQREHVLHVRSVEELKSAEFHERDIPPGEPDLERSAVRGRAEQDGLLLEQRSFLAVFEDALDDVACLVAFVADRH
jgi:hypothetical protein